jgi:hypothetical protein
VTDSKRLVQVAAWLLLPIWLGSTAWLFWVFQIRDMRPFTDDPRPFVRLQGESGTPDGLARLLRQLADPGRPTVVHFLDPDCRCSRFNAPHVERIRERFEARGVRFLTVEAGRPAATDPAMTALPRKLAEWLPIPASPAAMVLDGQSDIVYFGPFSVGAGCLTGSGDFVERTLERVLAGDRGRHFNVLDSGCYCDWPETAAQTAPHRGFAAS